MNIEIVMSIMSTKSLTFTRTHTHVPPTPFLCIQDNWRTLKRRGVPSLEEVEAVHVKFVTQKENFLQHIITTLSTSSQIFFGTQIIQMFFTQDNPTERSFSSNS